jgi:hypothetical protein
MYLVPISFLQFHVLRIQEQDTQHNTQQDRTQLTNSNTHVHRGNLYINNISNEKEDSSFLAQ